jgi:G3E family GTPase
MDQPLQVVKMTSDVVEFSNGCVCCTLRPDFVKQMAKLSSEGKVDYIIVESSGISEPMQVAEAFDMPSEDPQEDAIEAGSRSGEADESNEKPGEKEEVDEELQQAAALLRESAFLDAAVTVVDAFTILDMLGTSESLADRGMAAGEGDEREVAELLIDQLEFADIILLNKVDLVLAQAARRGAGHTEEAEAQLRKMESLFRTLNPSAKIVRTTRGRVPIDEILHTGLFSMEKARAAPGWLRSLEGEVIPESLEYGISSFVYRARKPFHPQRLHDLIFGDEFQGMKPATDGDKLVWQCLARAPTSPTMEEDASDGKESGKKGAQDKPRHPLSSVLRSKGTAWFALPIGHASMIAWAHVGRVWQFGTSAPWWSDVPEDEWPAEIVDVIRASMCSAGDAPAPLPKGMAVGDFGDRRQELVFIGAHMDKPIITRLLDSALLTDDELSSYWDCIACPDARARYEDETRSLADLPWEDPWQFDVTEEIEDE